MNSFKQLFLANLKIIYRNNSGLFWTIVVPLGLYVALAVLPIPKIGEGLAYKNYALPGVVAYIVMQSGIYSLAYWMVDLKTRGVIKRFLVTPIKNSELVLSVIAARLTVIVSQIILITAVGVGIFHASFAGNIVSTLILTLLGGGIFLLVGLLIANFANSYEAAAPITAAIGMPFAFLGNIFFPVDILPKTFQIIARILPVTYLADGLRQAYLYAFDFYKIGYDIFILTLWLIAMLVVTISLFRLKE
jgi:ABC-2 type transport system permease protein